MTTRKGIGLGLVGVLVLIGVFGRQPPDQAGAGATTAGPAMETAAAVPTAIPFEIVHEWRIGGEHVGRIVVIDSTYRTEPAMRRVGEELYLYARRDHVDLTQVYDNAGAAVLRNGGLLENLPPKQQAFHDRHLVGALIYNKGRHGQWMFGLNGMKSDPVISVDYRAIRDSAASR